MKDLYKSSEVPVGAVPTVATSLVLLFSANVVSSISRVTRSICYSMYKASIGIICSRQCSETCNKVYNCGHGSLEGMSLVVPATSSDYILDIGHGIVDVCV